MVLYEHSGFLYHLKLALSTPLLSPSIDSLQYRQIVSTNVKSPQRRSTTALEVGVQTAVHAKIHSLEVVAGANSL